MCGKGDDALFFNLEEELFEEAMRPEDKVTLPKSPELSIDQVSPPHIGMPASQAKESLSLSRVLTNRVLRA